MEGEQRRQSPVHSAFAVLRRKCIGRDDKMVKGGLYKVTGARGEQVVTTAWQSGWDGWEHRTVQAATSWHMVLQASNVEPNVILAEGNEAPSAPRHPPLPTRENAESEHVRVAISHVHPSAARQNLAFEIVVQLDVVVVRLVSVVVVVSGRVVFSSAATHLPPHPSRSAPTRS
jgi:hypothetical protein